MQRLDSQGYKLPYIGGFNELRGYPKSEYKDRY
jgi:hypothetical protein